MKEQPKIDRLRKTAEKALLEKKEISEEFSNQDLQHLIQELQVHQIELEMQNEELRKAQEEIEKSRSRYAHLYESAPAAYFTFDRQGFIRNLNKAGVDLLGFEQNLISGKPFQIFVAQGFQEIFTRHLKKAIEEVGKQTVELELVKQDGSTCYVSMESLAAPFEKENEPEILSAVIDMTERKMIEQVVADSEQRLQTLSTQLLKAQEEERRKIAGDIHDSLGSDLSAAKLKLERVLDEFDGSRLGKKNLGEAIASIETCIKEVRRIQSDLRPSVLDDLGIGPAINWFCREFSQNFSIPVKKNIQIDEEQIPAFLKTVVFRTLQEALHNVAGHSRSDRAEVSLTIENDLLHLSIKDYGRGFDYEKDQSYKKDSQRGLGLSSMKERVIISGGDFQIHSGLGEGTEVVVYWDLRRSY